jgi:hypothetical protein
MAMTEDEAGRGLRAALAQARLALAGGEFAEQELLAEFISRLPEQLQEYWTTGEGGAKIRWCTHGAFERARRALRKYVKNPAVLDGLVANLYHRACGVWPGKKKG